MPVTPETDHSSIPEADDPEFLVSYDLYGHMILSAPDAATASKRAAELIKSLIVKISVYESTRTLADDVRLGDLAITIENVESLEFVMDNAHPVSTPNAVQPPPPDHDWLIPDMDYTPE